MTAWDTRPACRAARVAAAAGLAFALAAGQEPASLGGIAESIKAGRGEEAVRMADGLIAAGPRDPRPHTLKGLALTQLGRSEAALAAYAAALELAPDYLPALQGAAELEVRMGRPLARERLQRILELQPGNIVAHGMLGVVAQRAGDCELALRHFARAETAVLADPSALRQRAECRFALGQFGEAADDFRLLAAGQPDAALRYNLGLALYEAGRAGEAVPELRAAADGGRPPDIDTLSLLAEAQRAALDPPGALATLRQAIAQHPRAERLYLQLAELCLEHGAYDLGVEVADAGARNIPGSRRILTMRGVLLAELGRYDEAEAAFGEASAADSDAQSAAVGLSLTLQKTGRMDESLEVLKQRVEANPDDAVAQYFYAQALIKRGVERDSPEFETALAGLQLAAEQLAGEAAPRIELGKLHMRAGKVRAAVAVLEEAVRLAPDDRQATYNLMIALRRAGRADEAAALAVRMREQLEQAQGDEIRRNRYRLVRGNDSRP